MFKLDIPWYMRPLFWAVVLWACAVELVRRPFRRKEQ
jgi:hypothetical protein